MSEAQEEYDNMTRDAIRKIMQEDLNAIKEDVSKTKSI